MEWLVAPLMRSVNLRRRDLDDPDHWYCFECSDYKPSSGNRFELALYLDTEEDYNYAEDLQKQREMNHETRKRVRTMRTRCIFLIV